MTESGHNNNTRHSSPSLSTTNGDFSINIPHFPIAGQPDIIRSLQKDEYYSQVLTSYVKEILQWSLGTRQMMKYEREISLISQCAYYVLTTLTNQRTLGEEYCDLIQVNFANNDNSNNISNDELSSSTSQQQQQQQIRYAPFTNRFIMVFLSTVFPYIWQKSSPILHKWLNNRRRKMLVSSNVSSSSSSNSSNSSYTSPGETHESSSSSPSSSSSSFLTSIEFDKLVQYLLQFHLAIFYMTGTYLQVSKRLTGIRYVFTGGSDMHRPHYRALGILILTQQFVSFYLYMIKAIEARRERRRQIQLAAPINCSTDNKDISQPVVVIEHEVVKTHNTSNEQDDEMNDDEYGKYRCSLCLGRRKQTTATPCGHLFCWECITECCASSNTSTNNSVSSSSAKCPICRQDISIRTLARVYHYDQPLT